MPPLLLPGYWPKNYFPAGHWDPDYWPHFTLAIDGGGAPGRWEPMFVEWPRRDDDDDVLVILNA